MDEAISDFFALVCDTRRSLIIYSQRTNYDFTYAGDDVRKCSDLYVQAPLKSTKVGSLQFIRNGHLLFIKKSLSLLLYERFIRVGVCDNSEQLSIYGGRYDFE